MEGIPSITLIPVISFAVLRVIGTVPREEHIFHVEVLLLSYWQTRPCERASGKAEEQDLACRGLTFLPLDMDDCLFDASASIEEA